MPKGGENVKIKPSKRQLGSTASHTKYG